MQKSRTNSPWTQLWALCFCLVLPAFGNAAEPPTTWDQVYDPFVVRDLNVRVSQADWEILQADETFSILRPATFWSEGETNSHAIKIRRKSATALGEKISYKVDFGTNRWHDIKRMSLENGDDNNVVAEGFAWWAHRLAINQSYLPSLASWATLTVHVERPLFDEQGAPLLDELGNRMIVADVRPQGLYLNVEQPDKQFLRHRQLWNSSTSYFYKQDDIGLPELKETPSLGADSPAYKALDFSPFQATRTQGKKILNPTPSDASLDTSLNQWIDMESMLRLGAVNAYTDNPDELFNKGKNFFWVDFETTASDYRRVYFPWDLDASIRKSDAGIYGTLSTTTSKGGKKTATVSQHPYQSVILNHAGVRARYNAILLSLLDGPMAKADLQADLVEFETLLTPYLLVDPNNQIGSTPTAVADYFANLRRWVAARDASVRSQIAKNGPPAPRP